MKRGKIVIACLLLVMSLGLGLAACQPADTKYMILFNSNGGLPVESISTDGKSKVELPTPTWTDHNFKGWFIDKDVWSVEFTENYLVSNPITANLTVYAKWEEIDNRPEIAVENPTYNGGPLTYGDSLPAITTATTGGTIALNAGQTLKAGSHNYNWTFTPTDTSHKYTNTTGTITLEVRKAEQSISATLEITSFEKTSITVTALGALYEYSKNETDWQDSNVFGELTPDTEYTFYARLKSTENYNASESVEVTGSTLPDIDNSIFVMTGTQLTGISDAGKQLESIVVPSAVNDVAVKSVAANAFDGCAALKSLRLPTSITSFEKGALAGLTGLTSLSTPFSGASSTTNAQYFGFLFGADNYEGNAAAVPAGLKTVVFTAQQKMTGMMFSGCGSITSLTIPSTNWDMQRSCLTGLTSLETLIMPYIDQSMGYYYAPTAHDAANKNVPLTLKYIEFTDNATIKDYTFTDITGIEQIIFPAAVSSKTIGIQAFAGCTSLKELKIPNGINMVGQAAFAQCTSLVKIELPDSIVQFGDSAFSQCTKLKSIEIPANTLDIANGMFWFCYALETVTFRGDITIIRENAFEECYSLKQLDFPASLTTIGTDRPFSKNYALTAINVDPANTKYMSIDGVLYTKDGKTLIKYPASKPGNNFVIPESVGEILKYAFDHASILKNLTISKNVVTINRDTFWNCTGLESVIFAQDSIIETLGYYSFDGCTSLSAITFPKSLIKIDNRAFIDCTSLSTVNFGTESSLTTLGSGVFENCVSLVSIKLPKSITTIGIELFKGCTGLTTVEFEEGFAAKSFGSNAFQGCTALVTLTLPDSITSLSQMMFYKCTALETLYLPAGLMTVGNYVFTSCTAMLAIYIDDSNEKFKTVDGALFSKDGTTLIYYPIGKADTSYNIPEGTVTLAPYAFLGAPNLTNVIIPSTLSVIGENTFDGALALTEIYIPINVTGIMRNAFTNCDPETLTIYAEADSKPAGWYQPNSVSSWNPANCPVVWGAPPLMDYSLLYVYGDGKITGLTDEAKTREALYVPSAIDGEAITQINTNAFAGASLLKKLYIYTNIETMQINSLTGATALEYLQIPFTGSAKDGAATNNFGYIFGSSNYYNQNNNIPASLKSIKLLNGSTKIANDAYRGLTNLESIILPETLIEIGNTAFQKCESLDTIQIPASVTAIGINAFYQTMLTAINVASANTVFRSVDGVLYDIDLTALWVYPSGKTNETVIIPNSVSSMKVNAFYKTLATNVSLPEILTELPETAFTSSANLTTVTLRGNSLLEKVGNYAFKECTSLQSFAFPAGIHTIGMESFLDCSALETITFATTQDFLANSSAFKNCVALESVVLPEGMTKTGTSMFEGCTSLSDITIPSTLKTLANYTFKNTALAGEISLPGLTSWGDLPFQNCAVTAFNIADSETALLKSVGGVVYSKDGTKLIAVPQEMSGTLNVEEGTVSLEKYSIQDCTKITALHLPSTYQSYVASAFANTTGIISITVSTENQQYSSANGLLLNKAGDTIMLAPRGLAGTVKIAEGITSINTSAFTSCINITNIIFPSTLINIENQAFEYCTGLEEIFVPASITTIKSNVFRGCTAASFLAEPASRPSTWNSSWNGTRPVTYGAAIPLDYIYTISEGAITGLTAYGKTLSSLTIPATDGVTAITEIAAGAFKDCIALTSLTLSSTITTIGANAFEGCTGLTEIFIPATVATMGADVFLGCDAALTINCQAASKPEGWDTGWNPDSLTVAWGYVEP